MNSTKTDQRTLHRFTHDILCVAGVAASEVAIIADVFIWFDPIGRYINGIDRLPAYVKRLPHGLIKSPCHPEFIWESNL